MVTIFLEDNEASEDRKNLKCLNDYYDRNIQKSEKQQPLEEKFFEPYPIPHHKSCGICNVDIDNFVEHVHSSLHQTLSKSVDYTEIDKLIF